MFYVCVSVCVYMHVVHVREYVCVCVCVCVCDILQGQVRVRAGLQAALRCGSECHGEKVVSRESCKTAVSGALRGEGRDLGCTPHRPLRNAAQN